MRRPISVPPCPPHIPQGLAWDRIRASALRDMSGITVAIGMLQWLLIEANSKLCGLDVAIRKVVRFIATG